jgi:hypothetical protein
MAAKRDGTLSTKSSIASHFRTLEGQIADCTYGMTAADYAHFLVRLGFEPIMDDAVGSERFHVYGREWGGIIVTYDTFHRQRNCASVQFRTNDCIEILPPDSLIEDIVGIDARTAHIRLDGRKDLLASLSLFEELTGFIEYWGNKRVPDLRCGLVLEQDAAVALREGISPRDMTARLQEVSLRRSELLPKEWQYRLDATASRDSAEARAMSSLI